MNRLYGIENRGDDEILAEFARGHRLRWIRPNTVGAKPIGKFTRRVGRAKKHRPRANVLIGKQQSTPSELDFKGGGDLDAVIVFLGIEQNRKPDLFEIAQAVCLLRLGLCLAQRRQQHPSQNGDDGDDDQQFDERESERA